MGANRLFSTLACTSITSSDWFASFAGQTKKRRQRRFYILYLLKTAGCSIRIKPLQSRHLLASGPWVNRGSNLARYQGNP